MPGLGCGVVSWSPCYHQPLISALSPSSYRYYRKNCLKRSDPKLMMQWYAVIEFLQWMQWFCSDLHSENLCLQNNYNNLDHESNVEYNKLPHSKIDKLIKVPHEISPFNLWRLKTFYNLTYTHNVLRVWVSVIKGIHAFRIHDTRRISH